MSPNKDVFPYCYCTLFNIVIIIPSLVISILLKIPSLSTVPLVAHFYNLLKKIEHWLAAATNEQTGIIVSSLSKKPKLLCIASEHTDKSGKRVSAVIWS